MLAVGNLAGYDARVMDMKKAIFLAAMMGLPVFGGQPAAIAPAPVPTPQVPAAASPWEVELGASYNWGVPDIYRDWSPCKEVKSIGGDITAVYRVSEHSALTLRFGYSWGGAKWANDVEISGDVWEELTGGAQSNMKIFLVDKSKMQTVIQQIMSTLKKPQPPRPSTPPANNAIQPGPIVVDDASMPQRLDFWTKTRIHTFNFMPGYRYTSGLTRDLSLYAGVNAGIANASNKLGLYVEVVRLLGVHDAAWGFAYSAELGLSYAVTPTVNVFAAYQFSGNTAKCKLRSEYGDVTAKRQHYHGIRTGVGFRF